MFLRRFALAVVVAAVVACGSSASSDSSTGTPISPPATACDGAVVPTTLHLTVSGFVTCACFNGTFLLTRDTQTDALDSWASTPITGCPGQTDDAYLKMSFATGAFGFGITGQGSEPGSGESDFSPVSSGTCSPLALSGAGSRAGNIESFCPGVEDEDITWSVTD